MFAHSEFLCHLAHDVKKLFSVRGKLTVFSDLSSNLSDTQKTERRQLTRKINLKFDLHENTAGVEKHLVYLLVSVYHKNDHSKILNQFPIAQYFPITSKSACKPFIVA